MTANQIEFWKTVETKRSNLARESETKRSNMVAEAEVHRSNVVRETETERHNRATESISWGSIGLGYKQLAETQRHNAEVERETQRHNVANELEATRTNMAHESVARQNAQSNQTSANAASTTAQVKAGELQLAQDYQPYKKAEVVTEGLRDVANAYNSFQQGRNTGIQTVANVIGVVTKIGSLLGG